MPTINPIRLATLKAIGQLGLPTDRLFQATSLREQLGFDTNSDESHAMHAVLHDLGRKGIIRAHDTGRSRNRYLQVVQAEALEDEIDREEARAARARARRSRERATIASTNAVQAETALLREDIARLETRLVRIEDLLGALVGRNGGDVPPEQLHFAERAA